MREIRVKPGGTPNATGSANDPIGTIGEAIEKSTPGTRIIVADGIYHEVVKIRNRNSITIVSENGPDRCSIDGEAYSLKALHAGDSLGLPLGPFVGPGRGRRVPTDGVLNDWQGKQHQAIGFVWDPLVRIEESQDISLRGFSIVNSRGRGVGISKSRNVFTRNLRVRNCREALWHCHSSSHVTLRESTLCYGGMFAQVHRSSTEMNWPGCVNMIESTSVMVKNCFIHHVNGEALIAGRGSKKIVFESNDIASFRAVGMYFNGARDVTAIGNRIWNSWDDGMDRGDAPAPCVVFNWEAKEFPDLDAGGNIAFTGNLVFTLGKGVSFWGNQGDKSQVTDSLSLVDNRVIAYGENAYPLYSHTNGGAYSSVNVTENMFHSSHPQKTAGGSEIGENFLWERNQWSAVPKAWAQGEGDTYRLKLKEPVSAIKSGEIPEWDNYNPELPASSDSDKIVEKIQELAQVAKAYAERIDQIAFELEKLADI